MAHNVIKLDCHYLQIHLAAPQGLFNEKCSLITRWQHLFKLDVYIFLQLWCLHLLHRCTLPPPCSPTFLASSLLFCFVGVVCNFSICLFICLLTFLDLFVSRPVGRFLTGVALVEPSPGIKRQRQRQALSHYAGPPPPALIESSDPKLMRRGARAHFLSTAHVLHKQTGELQWQCWIRSVGPDNPPSNSDTLDISFTVCKCLKDALMCSHICFMNISCISLKLCWLGEIRILQIDAQAQIFVC